MKFLSKSRKLQANRKIRTMTVLMDSCAKYPDNLDVVDLIANLDKVSGFISEYRKVLVAEARETHPAKFDRYFNVLAQRALREVAADFQAMFDANPDILRDNSKIIDGTVADQTALGA